MPLVALFGLSLLVVLVFLGVFLAGAIASVVHALTGVAWIVLLVAAYLTRRAWLGAAAAACAVAGGVGFALDGLPAHDLPAYVPLIPAVALIAGALVFTIGGLHFALPSLAPAARAARLTALGCVALALVLLGTHGVAGYSAGVSAGVGALSASAHWLGRAALMGLLAAVAALVNHQLQARIPRLSNVEGPVVWALVALAVGYLFLPLPGAVFVLLFNVVAFAALGAACAVAVRRGDRRLLDLAGGALVALIIARFSELAWPQLTAGTFAMCGAGLLVAALFIHLFVRARTPAAPTC